MRTCSTGSILISFTLPELKIVFNLCKLSVYTIFSGTHLPAFNHFSFKLSYLYVSSSLKQSLNQIFLTASVPPHPHLCRPPQSRCNLDRVPCQGLRQSILLQQYNPLLHRRPSLLDTGIVVCRPELLLVPERCDEVSYDETGLRLVLRGRFHRIREIQARLLHRQARDLYHWRSFSQAMKEVRNEGFLQCLLHWAEGVSDVGGEPLHKFPLSCNFPPVCNFT